MKQAWFAVLLAAIPVGTRAEEACAPGVQLVTAYVSSFGVEDVTLFRAKYVATQVMAKAGVTLTWKQGKLPDHSPSPCGHRLTIVFDSNAPRKFNANTIGYTYLNGTWSTEVHIICDRASLIVDPRDLPRLLGHIVAHEITHVLQGVPHHSSEGVMKAGWDGYDFVEMIFRPLRFTPEDVELIRARFEQRKAGFLAARDERHP
jgi:hypothetical protein